MAKVLIFTEYGADTVKNVSLEILGKLNGHDVDVVGIGSIPADGQTALKEHGAANIHNLNGEGLDKYSPEGYANALKEFVGAGSYDYVFAGSTSIGKDLFPRLSAMFEAGMASELVDFKLDGDNFTGTRPLFAGKCLADLEILGPKPHFVTVRPNSLGLSDSPAAGAGNVADASGAAGEVRAQVTDVIKGKSEKPDLTEANIIVSGGRAMKEAANFAILDELADVIGATVGASRAAVDSGYAPHDMQVGQTGKTVSPSLYIACGISGAIQHLAGMRTSKVIVAVNTDPDAPIFQKADYGIVGDLFKVVPEMTKQFKEIL
jgi:electron transfer flavoprotein alpha subunit